MTAQVVDACVRAVNEVERGPVFGAPLDLAVVTGDNTDNSQSNELDWYLTLLDGGRVEPDSGDRSRYEGVADDAVADERFWRPTSTVPDVPRAAYGFPSVPGLLDAVRRAVRRAGPAAALAGGARQPRPDAAGHGARAPACWARWPVGDRKAYDLPDGYTPEQALELLAGLAACEPGGAGGAGGVPHARGHRRPGPAGADPQGVRRPAPGRRRPAGRARLPARRRGVLPARRRPGAASWCWTPWTSTAAGRARWTGRSWTGWPPSWPRPTRSGATSSWPAITRSRPWSTTSGRTGCSRARGAGAGHRATAASCSGWPGTPTRSPRPRATPTGRSSRRR